MSETDTDRSLNRDSESDTMSLELLLIKSNLPSSLSPMTVSKHAFLFRCIFSPYLKCLVSLPFACECSSGCHSDCCQEPLLGPFISLAAIELQGEGEGNACSWRMRILYSLLTIEVVLCYNIVSYMDSVVWI